MKSFWATNHERLNTIGALVRKWRWLILSGVGLSLLMVEIQEFLVFRVRGDGFHYFEVLIYAVLLTISGLLIELFARSNEAYKQAANILEYKHNLSLEFTSNEEWDSLTDKLAEIPSQILDTEISYFLIASPINGTFEVAGQWKSENSSTKASWDPSDPCQTCQSNIVANRTGINLHKYNDSNKDGLYCLDIINPFLPPGIIRFALAAGVKLRADREKIFSSIGDEIMTAMQASLDRRRISELKSAEVAMAERRLISTYVHDQLGQNLGYLHLKLDQLAADGTIRENKAMESEIKRLREVANESYEIVRDILKKMQSTTVPHLTNLMHEHARSISKRAGFTLDFKSNGHPINLHPNAQQTIFFTFREMLINVEKHAGATRAEVIISWNDDILDISVADNGKGFDSNEVCDEDHFGLSIMQERTANLNGRMNISSRPDSGTVVSIAIPLEQIRMVPHG